MFKVAKNSLVGKFSTNVYNIRDSMHASETFVRLNDLPLCRTNMGGSVSHVFSIITQLRNKVGNAVLQLDEPLTL